MTGYGKGVAILEGGKLTVEFRSVNGKNAEISIKSSLIPKDREMALRRKITDTLQRGTIDMFVTWEPNAAESARKINADAVMGYWKQLEELCSRVGSPNAGMDGKSASTLMSGILRLPDVVDTTRQEVINEDNWPLVDKAIDEALAAIDKYRSDEGASLYRDVTSRVQTILDLYSEVEKLEPERAGTAKARIEKAAADAGVKLDRERFEQEMIFYLEKYDINEEKVRLRQHCAYFMDTIDSEACPGKKLGFIIQEMGREINTTGSKANHAGIQQLVVRMKDELEKIREQSMNIL